MNVDEQPVEYIHETDGMEPPAPIVMHELRIHLTGPTVNRPTSVRVVPRIGGYDWAKFSTITFADERNEATLFFSDVGVIDQLEERIAQVKQTAWYKANVSPSGEEGAP